MKEITNDSKLKSEILLYSNSKDFKEAKKEWKLNYVFIEDSNCICGQTIKKCCEIININTNKKLVVGSVCVNNFLGIQNDHLFHQLSAKKKYDKFFVEHLKESKRINEWEKEFLISLIKFKKLSSKQQEVFNKINKRIKNR